MSTKASSTRILHYRKELLVSGLAKAASRLPLVAIEYKNKEEKIYRVSIHVYIPANAQLNLDETIEAITAHATEAGTLDLRDFNMDYLETDSDGQATAYNLWQLVIEYQVDGAEAQGINILQPQLGNAMPGTKRGTVTIVSTT